MSDPESWIPEVGEIDRAVGSYIPAHRVAAIRTLIRDAVMKALVEQAVRMLQATEEIEARHRRELIEARIAELENWYDSDADDAIGIRLTYLRSELAALDGKAPEAKR